MNFAFTYLMLVWFIIKDVPKIQARGLGWSFWTEWSSCHAPCDGGYRSRRRYCRSQFCNGIYYEVKQCTHEDCRATTESLHGFQFLRLTSSEKLASITVGVAENGEANDSAESAVVKKEENTGPEKSSMGPWMTIRTNALSSFLPDGIARTVLVVGALVFTLCAVVFTIFRVIIPYRRNKRQRNMTSVQYDHTYYYPNCSPRDSKTETAPNINDTNEANTTTMPVMAVANEAPNIDTSSSTHYTELHLEDAESIPSNSISSNDSKTLSYVSDVMWF